MAIAQTPTKKIGHIDTFMPIYGSKFQIPFVLKIPELFDISKNLKNWHLTAQ